ncbi:MAG TPA: sigma-70 family RNA polymerase sigma factor [Clostridia bacterium]|nr:sigma-70 family RNA polymerase sigma factor [Clostridia bacterium]
MDVESQLIDRFKEGDFTAFEELIYLFDKKIYNYCYRMTNNPNDAEDLAQEVFIKVYRSLKSFREDSKFSTWIYRIAYNTCIDEYRRKKIKVLSLNKNIPSPEPLPEDRVIYREEKDLIEKCIAEMKPNYKSAIILRDIQGYSYEEIAGISNIPIGTVKSNISRARGILRDVLKSQKIQGNRRAK